MEGRRLLAIPGGWQIVNYLDYRNRLQEKDGSKARAMRESRERKKASNTLPNVTLPASASAFAKEDEVSKSSNGLDPDYENHPFGRD